MRAEDVARGVVGDPPPMTDEQYQLFRELIHKQTGIALNPGKKEMVSSRLIRRLRAHGLASYEDYYTMLTADHDTSDEIIRMIDVVTTNKTEFFREKSHFEFLRSRGLPQVARRMRMEGRSTLQTWSAGCSTGEEPYSLAMILAEFFATREGGFHILASDISSTVLAVAQRGVYDSEAIAPVPAALQYRYLMRGKGRQMGHYRVVPELRQRVTWSRLNLMEPSFDIGVTMDLIFCRNVIIYFDRPSIAGLVRRFHRHLRPQGYLFIGHSETLSGLTDRFQRIMPTVYQRVG